LSVGLLEISEYISEEERKTIEKGLADHTLEEGVCELVFTPLSILKRDDSEQIVAGLYGESFWNALYIDSFWVKKELRNNGIGTEILKAAEEEAKRRKCLFVYLWTQDFDAPDFYKKQGYKEFVAMPDFPVGHSRIGFMKRMIVE